MNRTLGFGHVVLAANLCMTGCASDADDGDDAGSPGETGTDGESDTGGDTDGDPTAGTQDGTEGDPALPDWEEHDCAMDIPAGLSGADFLCGTLTVPDDWQTPSGETVTMEVAVLRAEGGDAAPDPLVFFGGGPGVWNLEGYLQSQATNVLAPLRETRDIVFFDKRGNGLSQPALACPEYDEEFVMSFTVEADAATDAEAYLRGYQRCRDRLDAEGIDPSVFHSAAVSHDVAALMEALGYETYNLYGLSYGGREAQVMLREHPERVRSVILDSSVVTEISNAAMWPANFETAFDVMAQQCADAESCGASYPDLKATMVEAIEVLNAAPHTTTVAGPDDEDVDVVITGDRFALGIHSAMYRADLLSLLPAAIGGAALGETSLIDLFAPSLIATGGIDRGLYASTLCAEELPFDTAASIDAAREGLTPTLTDPVYETNGGYMLEMCEIWNVPAAPAVEAEPIVSDVPALILGGNFDPVSPPSYAETLQANLSQSQAFLFNGIGHGVLRSDTAASGELSCAQQVITSFLDAPMDSVDGACANALDGPY